VRTPFRDRIRKAARRCLPDAIRKPLGNVAFRFDESVVQPVEGFIFDISGGRFKTDGCTFIIPKDQTSPKYRALFLTDAHEADMRTLVREFVRPTDSVIELGGCLGVVACVTNKLLADKTRHVVVEGNPFLMPVLHRNRFLNGSDFLIENCAVSSQPEVTFYLDPSDIQAGTAQRKNNQPVRMPSRSLAELDARYGPFTTLVIDIEGAELEVFEHSRELLRRYRLVLAELHTGYIGKQAVEQCRSILAEAGLRFKRRSECTEFWQTEAWQRD